MPILVLVLFHFCTPPRVSAMHTPPPLPGLIVTLWITGCFHPILLAASTRSWAKNRRARAVHFANFTAQAIILEGDKAKK